MSISQGYHPDTESLKASDRIAFREELFRSIIAHALDGGYRFSRFDDQESLIPQTSTPTFYLRHDVDISPDMAFRLGEIEHDRGIDGNFFFQLNAETYSFFGSDTLTVIRDLRRMGHCVGLHIDEQLLGLDEQAVRSSFDWVNRHVVPIDPVVSFHRPSPAVLGHRFESILSTYDDRVFDPESYLSDSRRSLAFHEPLMNWIKQGRPRIQLLLHPEWWDEVSSLREFWTLLSRRRTNQLRQYMLDNFPKVFAEILNGDGGNHMVGRAASGSSPRLRASRLQKPQ